MEDLFSVIKKWKPGKLRSEKQFENSLYEYLHKAFPEKQITKQFGIGRVLADLAISDELLIEMKYNLKTTGQFQRLVGQLSGYKKWKGSVLIILCGTTESNLLKELNECLKELNKIESTTTIAPIMFSRRIDKYFLIEK